MNISKPKRVFLDMTKVEKEPIAAGYYLVTGSKGRKGWPACVYAEDERTRCYWFSGNRKDNLWVDLESFGPVWMPLAWQAAAAAQKESDLEFFGDTPPPGFPTKPKGRLRFVRGEVVEERR